jgi:hypothetical protein
VTVELSGYGITSELPPGWEGRITRRPDPTDPGAAALGFQTAAELRTHPVAHLANFALPPDRGDFGSGAVELMGADDALVVLFEYGPESLGTALFAPVGLPTRLGPEQFSPRQLQRVIPGQAGYQTFFTAEGRPFCLYVVLGSHARAPVLVPEVNTVIAATVIGSR